jgi:predicted nucleic acid-binding protein
MTGKHFIDTNILAYAYGPQDLAKQAVSRRRLLDLENRGAGVISTQVLQEFYVAATRKLFLPAAEVAEIMQAFDCFEVVEVAKGMVFSAVVLSQQAQVSFWDALIVTSAQAAGCESVLTEDLQHGQVFGSVRVENPFLVLVH